MGMPIDSSEFSMRSKNECNYPEKQCLLVMVMHMFTCRGDDVDCELNQASRAGMMEELKAKIAPRKVVSFSYLLR